MIVGTARWKTTIHRLREYALAARVFGYARQDAYLGALLTIGLPRDRWADALVALMVPARMRQRILAAEAVSLPHPFPSARQHATRRNPLGPSDRLVKLLRSLPANSLVPPPATLARLTDASLITVYRVLATATADGICERHHRGRYIRTSNREIIA
ncbi:MAG: hypothetical protein ACYDA1_07210 [Vulcanimicrobiaceae bacterium]